MFQNLDKFAQSLFEVIEVPRSRHSPLLSESRLLERRLILYHPPRWSYARLSFSLRAEDTGGPPRRGCLGQDQTNEPFRWG